MSNKPSKGSAPSRGRSGSARSGNARSGSARAAGGPRAMPPSALRAMQAALHGVAEHTIAVVADEVPAYRGALDDDAQVTLARAVELALSGFLALAADQADPSAPLAPALEGAYALGRGEARAGRSMDALLAAYRVGARSSWRGLAEVATEAGLAADGLVAFAELVFAYIDQLSAASVAGHAAELANEDRVRQRHLERLGHGLVTGASEAALASAAQRAGWTPPNTLTAVLLAEDRLDAVLARIDPRTLQPVEDIPGMGDDMALLLVPDAGETFRTALARGLGQARAVIGPSRPWLRVRESFALALRAWDLRLGPTDVSRPGAGEPGAGGPGAARGGGARTGSPGASPPGIVRTDDVLAELVVGADPDALAELRRRALAPLADLRSAQADRLIETLRSWLLHRGRRDAVAADLFVHPQTVRYRMGQLREAFGERLDDPRHVLELTIALAVPIPAAPPAPSSPAPSSPAPSSPAPAQPAPAAHSAPAQPAPAAHSAPSANSAPSAHPAPATHRIAGTHAGDR
jgi:hypothetical protein